MWIILCLAFSMVFAVDGNPSNAIDLGKLKMNFNPDLATVNVVTIRPIIEVKPDMTVFNVEGTLNATGANGFDLLRKAPGVIIDNNNNIVLEGKSGVQIYVDNKPTILAGDDLINYLKHERVMILLQAEQ